MSSSDRADRDMDLERLAVCTAGAEQLDNRRIGRLDRRQRRAPGVASSRTRPERSAETRNRHGRGRGVRHLRRLDSGASDARRRASPAKCRWSDCRNGSAISSRTSARPIETSSPPPSAIALAAGATCGYRSRRRGHRRGGASIGVDGRRARRTLRRGALLVPRRFRWTSIVHQLDRVGVRSVPIIVLITLLIGAIIAQQGFFHFRQFGADDYVVDLVGILTLREIGVLIVSIMVAGRSGSSYTAELGSMKMREEIDALRTMGRDPLEILVLPRIIALVVALPLLTLDRLVGRAHRRRHRRIDLRHEPSLYVARLREAVSISDFEVGMIKAPFMALVIGLVACTEGFQVRGSSESLGARTTSSVVKAIFLVIVLDGIFAMFFSSIGM